MINPNYNAGCGKCIVFSSIFSLIWIKRDIETKIELPVRVREDAKRKKLVRLFVIICNNNEH